jgi:flagellar protein FlaI
MVFGNLRGLLYRKLAEQNKLVEDLPGFKIEKTTRIFEFPKIEDIKKVSVTYPLIEPFAYASIKWDPEMKQLIYQLVEPELNEDEKKLLNKISEALIDLIEVGLTSIKESKEAGDYLEKQVLEVIKNFGLSLTPNQYTKLMYYIYRNFIGYNEIEGLLHDPNIEDISCDGIKTPVFIMHRKLGSIRTNIFFNNSDNLREFIVKLAERSGRYVSYAEPILDGSLPDGSRVSATVAEDVATRGATFTIRKFGEKPISPIDQLDLKTASPEILAYFWFLIENGANVLIVGGTATGKTSFMNSICMFIPYESKVVSIEDTREIRIPHEHWISGLSRVGFGIPLPTGEKYGEVTMYDLLRESFRQNPDYVIVGETRGAEASVMFQGMASGHTSISTFHAGSLDNVVKRLISPPINLSPTLIESLNVVSIMVHAREKGKAARRIKEITEIISVDPKTDEVRTNLVYVWNALTDVYEKVNDSIIIKNIIEAKGGTIEDAVKDIERRKKILEWLQVRNIKDYLDVIYYINLYRKEPEKLLELMKGKIDLSIVSEGIIKEEKPKKRVSILELLGGFKFIREK